MVDAKVKLLAIVFDRENETYYSGDVLSGKVLVEFIQPKKIRGIRIEIFGESVVGWSVSVPKPDAEGESHDVMTTSREEYLASSFYVLGSESSRAIELPVGQLSYPFRFQLPFDLPSSLEHSYGHIRYKIKAIFERPWKFNYEIKTAFNIISNYNLNQKPQASVAIHEEVHKSFCCFCICPTGNVHVKISVPSSGFVPGQMIPVTVQCENESTVDVSKIKLCLQRKLKFYATAPSRATKEEEVTMAETKCENPFTTNFEDQVTVQLKVPQLPPSALEFCAIIDLSYTLKVLIEFSGMHCSVERTFPILIGTVPLHYSVESYSPNAIMAPTASAPLMQEPTSMIMPFVTTPQPAAVHNVAPTNPPYPGNWDSNHLPPPPYDPSMYNTQGAGHPVAPQYPGQNYSPANVVAPGWSNM